MVNHGITTHKLNENAKKVIFSHKSRKYIFWFFGPRSFQFLKKNSGGTLTRATSLYIRKTFRGPLPARGAILWPPLLQ